MWILYAALAFILAVVLSVLGIWPVGLVFLIAVPVIALLGLRAGAKSPSVSVASTGAGNVPSSREAAYDPRVDPGETGPGQLSN